jgi:UDP-MurNAc hydroxylase
MNLERLGYTVIELTHNTTLPLKNGVSINLLAADDCNPALCHRYYGCGLMEAKYGSTQIDTMAVITDGTHTLLNVNDCPYTLAQNCLQKIKSQYAQIDFLLTPYLGAGPYPQCFESLNDAEKMQAAELKKTQFLQHGEDYIADIKPRYYMPFAGTYLLAGKLSKLNKYRGNPDIEEAKVYFEASHKINQTHSQCVLLNQNGTFDIANGTHQKPYVPIDNTHKNDYINNILPHKKLDYEYLPMPDIAQIQQLIPAAYTRMNAKRKHIKFETDTVVLIKITDEQLLKITLNDKGFEMITQAQRQQISKYVYCALDLRLLDLILQGPRYAHWNNAEGGSHIEFHRQPADLYERPLYYVMNFFHS